MRQLSDVKKMHDLMRRIRFCIFFVLILFLYRLLILCLLFKNIRLASIIKQ